MLFASGRLLACGWECMDQLAAAEASCHQDATPVTAMASDATHACLPEIPEPRVTVAKQVTDQWLMALPSVATIVSQNLIAVTASARQPEQLPDNSSDNRVRISA